MPPSRPPTWSSGTAYVTSPTLAYSTVAELGGGLRSHRLQQPGRGRGGHRQHDRVGEDLLGLPGRPEHQPPAARRAAQLAHHRPDPDRRAAAGACRRHRRRQPAEPAADAGEHRPGQPGRFSRRPGDAAAGRADGDAGGARSQHLFHRTEQRALDPDGTGELRQGRVQRELVGVAGVHTPEQRLDEPVDDLTAEPCGHEGAERDVATDRGAGQHVVQRDPGQARQGDHPAGGQRAQVAGDAHQLSRGQRPHRSPAPHGRPGDSRVHDVVAEPGRVHQRERLRPPGEQRLGAGVHGDAGDLGQCQLAADRGGPFEDRHVHLARGPLEQRERGRESGDPAADHDDVRSRRDCGHRTCCPCSCTRSTTRGEHVGVGLRQHAVAEVEDVPGQAVGGRQHRRTCACTASGGAKSDGGVEVALQRDVRPDPARPPRPAAPGSRRPTTSAPASRIAPSSSPVPTPKWIRGTGRPRGGPRHGREDRRRVRQHVLAVVASDSAPAQESNSCTAPAPGPRPARARNVGGDPARAGASRSCHSSRVAVHERLGAFVVAARAALDEVRRERERRAREPDQRRARPARP